ncbi:unnamed protein product [Rotaria socialis]
MNEKLLYDALRAQGVGCELFVSLFGQLPEIRRRRKTNSRMDFHQNRIQQHGNTYVFGFGPVIRLMINESDLLADVPDRSNARNYTKPPVAHTILGPAIGNHNLLVAEGNEHERARQMINPAFYHTNLKSMVSNVTDRTEETIQSVFKTLDCDKQSKRSMDIQVFFNSLTLAIIVSSACGANLETNENAKHVMGRLFTNVFNAILYHIIDQRAREIAQFMNQIITDRREGRSNSLSNGPDLLDLLLAAVDDEEKPFTDQEIKEEALTFVIAGSETTGNLMTWILYVLMTHDDVLGACREEVDRILSNGKLPTNDNLTDLVICEAIINETLRLYPPAPVFTRYCIREHIIGDEHPIRIPAGATILISDYLLHRRNDLWPRADEFDYTRWMRDPKTGLKPKLSHPFSYLPFAAGPRNCIGQNFALLEAKIMLAMFVQRCNFEMVPGQKIIFEVTITMRPKYRLVATISKR